MKSLVAVAAASAALLAMPSFAQAQTSFYGTAGYTVLDADDGDLGAIQGRVGARFNPYVGVEGEVAFGVKDEDVTVAPGVTAKLELEHQVAVYGVGFLPLSENTDLLARIGYGTAEFKAGALGVSGSEDFNAWAFGVGAQHHFDGKNGVRVDYTRHESDDDALDGAIDTFSIAYSRRF